MRRGRWLFYSLESSWLLFKAGAHKCHTSLSLRGVLINKRHRSWEIFPYHKSSFTATKTSKRESVTITVQIIHRHVKMFETWLGVGELAFRISCAASFPADCNVASLPFYGGDNSAPAVSASCV